MKSNETSFFEENGYIILKNIIPESDIDNLLNEFDNVVDNKIFNHWHTQNTHEYKKLKKNKEGFLEDSLQSPHAYCWSKEFRRSLTKIICNLNIQKKLKSILNTKNNYAIWQSMFFDKTTGTLGHQDSYYLDTENGGGVIGCWFALEDIKIESGPFYIIPKTHKKGLLYNEKSKERYGDHDSYVKSMKAFEKKNKKNIVPIIVKKGDIVLWHSLTFHGALNNTNDKFSRKSLTCHFFPLNEKLKFHEKLPNVNKPFDFKVPIMGYPSNFQNFKTQIKTLSIILKNKIKGSNVFMDMRRKSYE